MFYKDSYKTSCLTNTDINKANETGLSNPGSELNDSVINPFSRLIPIRVEFIRCEISVFNIDPFKDHKIKVENYFKT